MSLNVLGSLAAADGGGFQTPTSAEFYQPLWFDGPFAITRPAVVLMLSVGLIGWWLIASTRRAAVVPGKGQWVTEGLYGFVRNSVARDIIGTKDFLRYVPLLFSMFILILVNNLFGVIPPIQYPTMSRIGIPIALTLVVYVTYHYIGMKRVGVGPYFKHLVPAGLPGWIVPLIFVLEVITFFITRPLTLALRLFGNMFAGHLLLLLFITGGQYMIINGGIGLKIAGAGSYVMAFVLTIFEILIEFLQAYIFTLLAATYIAGSLVDEH
ncbi:MAG TPA: F0F1 ATP synthase subunit A [Dermatophilaceae bacterium]